MDEKIIDEQNRLILLREKLMNGDIGQDEISPEDLRKIEDMESRERETMDKVKTLSTKERALWDKLNTAPGKKMYFDQLTQSEVGIVGKLKQKDLVGIYRNYIEHVKYIKVK